MAVAGKSAGPGLAPLLLLVVVVGAVIGGVVWTTTPTEAPPDGAVPLVVVDAGLDRLAVRAAHGTLSVEFSTPRRSRCRISVGYDVQNLSFRRQAEKGFGRTHIFTITNLLPGTIHYRVSGEFEGGQRFDCPPASVVLRPDDTPASTPVAVVAGESRTIAAPAAITAPGSDTPASSSGTPLVVADASATTEGALGTVDGTSAGMGSTPGAADEVTDVMAGEAVVQESLVAGDVMDSGDPPLPNADPADPLGKKALDAARIDRSFGPASLDPARRAELQGRIERLSVEYADYGDLESARSLAEAHYELRNWRRALRFARAGVALQGDDKACHGICLSVYKRFAMGSKIQETYRKLLQLCPDDPVLRAQYERDSKIYGDFDTIGTPQVVSLK